MKVAPIVISCQGWFPGIAAQLHSFAAYSPATPVFSLQNCGLAESKELLGDYVELERIYEHHHPGPPQYMLSVFRQKFLLYGFCRRLGIESFWNFDWDVLLFADLTKETIQETTPFYAQSYTHRLQDVKAYLDFVMDVYRDKDKLHALVEQFKDDGEGIGAMRLARILYRHAKLEDNVDGAVFDVGMHMSQYGCVMDKIGKKLTWKNGVPWMQAPAGPIRMKTLHCWGPHKKRMAYYLRKGLTTP